MPRSRLAGLRVAFLSALTLLSIGGWYLLYGWYGVFEHQRTAHFGFEKIEGGFDSPVMRQTLLVFIGLGVAYGAAIWILRSLTSISVPARLIACVMFAAPAIANVALYPVGALDVFNYMIELKLAYHYDQNPYLVTFEAYRLDSFARSAFLVDIPLFYGPAWLLASWVPATLVGFDQVLDTLLALKIFNVVLIAATAWLIALHQRDDRSRWVAAFVFAANPLVLFEGVANAHNDVLMTTFLVAAMVALNRRSTLAGPLLVLSALVKLYTVVLVPIFIVVALRDRWGWKRMVGTTVLTVVTAAIVCIPYWGTGELVHGLRRGLEQSQEMDHVSLLSLAQQDEQEKVAEGRINANMIRSRPSAEIVPESMRDGLRNGFAAGFTLLALGIVATVRRGRPAELAAAETLLLMLLMLTNFYGWYLIPVIALLAMRLERLGLVYIAGATLLGLAYYPMYVYAHFNTEWTRYQVHLFLALFLTVPVLAYLVLRLGIGCRSRWMTGTWGSA